jgi:zinc protease
VATLTASMLLEGAGSLSSLELADAIDFLGADLSAAAGVDSSAVRLHVPVPRLAEALRLMADVALRPTFPAEELDRLRQERLTDILQARDNPATINAAAFSRVLYGPAHRYGAPANGTAETLRSFTIDDLRAFYASAFQPSNGALVVVGDVTMEKVLPLLESSFGGWKAAGQQRAPAVLPAPPSLSERTIYIVDKPGAPQSQIRIGWIGAPRSTPDYFPIQVMNTILGGSFSSRLNLNLRERNGYTYGASSGFDMRASAGPFIATAGVQTDKTSEALREFFNELNAILKTVPDDELRRSKNYVSLRYPSGFETTGDISRRLEEAIVYRLADDYFAKYVPNLEAVTAADVQRVAQKYVTPTRFAVVITGDRRVIEPGIQALKLGPIKVLTIDEVFGPPPSSAQR